MEASSAIPITDQEEGMQENQVYIGGESAIIEA